MHMIPELFRRSFDFIAKQDAGAGGLLGVNTFPGAFTESIWIATYTSFIIWLLALVFTPLSTTVSNGNKVTVPKSIRNFARCSRDSFLIMLGMTAINQSGFGVTSGVVAISWTVFALLVIWTILGIVGAYVPWPWWVDALTFLPIMVLAILNFGLAFRGAPSYK